MNTENPHLTEEYCLKRRERLWSHLPEHVEWIILGNPKHINYLSGFLINPIGLSNDVRSFLLLKRSGEAVLIGDNQGISFAAAPYYVDETVNVLWYDKIHAVRDRTRLVVEAVADLVHKLNPKHGLVEEEWVPTYIPHHEEASVSLAELLHFFRRTKDPDEIALMKHIFRASEAGHKRGFEVIKPGVSEMEIYLEIQKAALTELGEAAVVYGDFRAMNAENPKLGGLPTQYRLKDQDLFILDYGIIYRGYRSDFTSAIAAGTPTAEQEELHGYAIEILKETEGLLAPGTHTRDVFAAMKEGMEKRGCGKDFGGHAGHGLGMGHPEAPGFAPESDEVLMENEIVTLEPGIYRKDVGGIRLEHNYLITADGFEQLTRHSLELN